MARENVVDNGKQFDSEAFKAFCNNIGTKVKFASVYHPQSNGAVERGNGLIFSSIRKILFDEKRKGKWVDELPKSVWSDNTSESRATGFTPFRLLYGSETMIPEEIQNGSLRVQEHEAATADEGVDKDLIEVDILRACHNLESYQRQTRCWKDKNIKLKGIQVGDFVIKKKHNAHHEGKLWEKWEGPYLVVRSNRPGSYYLQDSEGQLPHTWNADSLGKYYI